MICSQFCQLSSLSIPKSFRLVVIHFPQFLLILVTCDRSLPEVLYDIIRHDISLSLLLSLAKKSELVVSLFIGYLHPFSPVLVI